MNQGARYDITIAQGSYFELPFTWKDASGNPIDNTGYSFTFQAKKAVGNLIIDLHSPTNIDLGGITGTVLVHIDDSVTAAYDFDILPYNIEYTPPNGRTKRLLYGFVTLSRDVAP